MEEARRFEVVTNNPEVQAILGADETVASVRYVPGTPLDVLDAAELRLQQGYRLVSAPLPPNIPLMRAPYRSLVLEEGERQYDTAGLLSLEKARERFRTQRAADSVPSGSERDFAFIDGEHLRRTLRDLRLERLLPGPSQKLDESDEMTPRPEYDREKVENVRPGETAGSHETH